MRIKKKSIYRPNKGLFNGLEVMNIHYQHNAQPLSLMEHPHQTKVVLFESLKAWLEAEMVADVCG